MRRGVRPSQLLVVVMLAFGGVGAGHVAEYLLLAPHEHDRHELLARTGHHYLPSALDVGAFLALVGTSLVFLLAFQRGLGRGKNRRNAACWSRMLPPAQVLGFIALEVGERVLAHASLADIGVVLMAGLPLQALVGFLASRIVAAVEQVGERAGVRFRGCAPTLEPARSQTWLPRTYLQPALSLSGAPIPARGPPRILVRA